MLLMVLGTTGADHCTTWTTSDPEVDAAGAYYVDNDLCQLDEDGCLFSIWTYAETNGIDGLQRGDEVVDDTCHGMIQSDSFICGLLPIALLTPRDRNAKRGASRAAATGLGLALVGTVAFAPTVDAC